ncbi:DNA-binding protein [Rhodococcus rhodnii]|uniref:Helix-turn-helix domain-containing protein n=2 Tax=Rhodococcus rhodnii TaxID=38312 RepID=R7WT14_9NOCA|nr:helix-turn-helix domain-containing protein [Rhodococcus rhodnii]EOM77284.1 hypothetical protein Rrhod_1346 [Rhodococcus rhodnii LMG 5362]TXG88254.1 DNA-binding protein [Rhodococcus rhodnii]TXG89054.1 DNA-binding protein [Rhodococcus rhodnii]
MTRPWPFPGDSQLDIARRLALAYRAALAERDPAACRALDAEAADFGQSWTVPQTMTVDEDDLVTAGEAADLVGVTAATVYQWAHRGYIERRTGTDGRTRYRVGDVLDHLAATRRRRAQSPPVGQSRV